MNKIEIDEIKNKMQQIEELLENDPDQAVSGIEKIDPRNLSGELKYDYYYLAGDVYYDRDKFDEAIKCYKVALGNRRLDKEDVAKIYANLAGLYADKDLFKYSISYANKSIKLSSNDRTLSNALQYLASSYLNLGNYRRSIDCLLRTLELYKEKRDNVWSKYMIESSCASLCFAYWKLGDEQNSEYYFNKLFSLDDVNPKEKSRAYLYKAHRLYERRQWKEALEYYEKSISLMNNDEEKQRYQKYIDVCKAQSKGVRPQL